MKKLMAILIAFTLIVSLAACSGGKETQTKENETKAAQEDVTTVNGEETSIAFEGTTAALVSMEWPEEFDAWDVPIIKNAKVVGSDNKSMENGILTQGINVIVNLREVTKADFDAYCEELAANGYVKSANSLADILVVYEKAVTGGVIKMTLTFDQTGTTIVANNSAAAAEKDTLEGGSTQWPQSAKAIPEFTKGKYVETVEMGGGMYTITFSSVTQADLDWYRSTLKSAGFVSQENEDTEGYSKLTGNVAYSVGFVIQGETLQIVVASGTY